MVHLMAYIANRFKGKKFKGAGSFTIPSKLETDEIISKSQQDQSHLFIVPSFPDTTAGRDYLVDMEIGQCECPIGMTGAPCKHQYVLWSHQMYKSSNFLPAFSAEDRQKFGIIALGST